MGVETQCGLLTVEQFLDQFQESINGSREELIEGEVIVSPNAKLAHSEVVRRLLALLRPLEDQSFVVQGEVACRLSPHSLPNPDVGVFRKDRWESWLAANLDYVPQAPSLAVEVVSPGNRKLHTKAGLYLEHGAEQVWLIYPSSQRVRVLFPDSEEDRDLYVNATLEFHGVSFTVREVVVG